MVVCHSCSDSKVSGAGAWRIPGDREQGEGRRVGGDQLIYGGP